MQALPQSTEYVQQETPRRAQLRKRPAAAGRQPTRASARAAALSAQAGPSSSSIAGRNTRRRSSSLTQKVSKLSIRSQSPSFEPPQTALPQSDEEQALSHELALCDFRTYLLAMEMQNRERIRQARGSQCICHEPDVNPIDRHPHIRDYQMAIQADELRRRRTELQLALERLTGRPYPLPDTYGQARQGPVNVCAATDIPVAQLVAEHAGGTSA